MVTFVVELYHDGLFASSPLRLVLEKPLSFFYVLPGVPMNIDDPWLNKLVGKGRFVGEMEDPIPGLKGRFFVEQNDSDENFVKPKYKVKEVKKQVQIDDSLDKDKGKVGEGSSHKDLGKGSAGGSSDKGKGKLGKNRNEPSKNSIRSKFMINVSLGHCKRAKQAALFDHEGGLTDHYSKIWQYRQVVLDSNPGSTCHIDLEEMDYGLTYFNRFYVCFFGLKSGCLEGCRKVIGLDGCFLTHTCKGQLLTAIGRDANNQKFLIAWVVVGVENKNNWCWFLSLLSDDLNLNDGSGLTVISDGHKTAMELNDSITPFARNHLEFMKIRQRVGRVMHCHRCWQSGHNKFKCTNAPKPKPDNFYEIPTDEERKHRSNDVRERDQYHKLVQVLMKYQSTKKIQLCQNPALEHAKIMDKEAFTDMVRKDAETKDKEDEINITRSSTEKAGSSANLKKKANKRKKKANSKQPLPFRIYHKNKGRSERIANLEAKKFKFDANGTGTTPDKAFDVSD
nr:hypothetical protein CTI12_AA159120 [Tanacetum cinerariifolium]